jgi:hypothetical protein
VRNSTLGFADGNADPPARFRLGAILSKPGGTSGTTSAEAAEARRTTTPWEARVNLPVLGSRFWLLARFDWSRFFTAFVIFHTPATAAAQEAEVVAAQGAEMVVAEGEAEKTRRRDDLGEAVVATAI